MQALLNKRGETSGLLLNKAVLATAPPHQVLGVVLGDVLYAAGTAPLGKFIGNYLYNLDGRRLARLADTSTTATTLPLSKQTIDEAKWQMLPYIHEFTLNWIATNKEWARERWPLHAAGTPRIV